MKRLTQDAFKIYPSWIKTLVVTSNGSLMGFACAASELYLYNGRMWEVRDRCLNRRTQYLTDKYDTKDWQNSAIERVYL